MKDRGGIRKMSQIMWALTNYGIVHEVANTRRECIRLAESNLGEPWRKCRRYMEVRKVKLVEL